MEENIGLLVAAGIIIGTFTAYIAQEKNRGTGAWFFLGLLFNIIALLAIVGLPVREKKTESEENDFTCTVCNSAVKESDKYCTNCGNKFDDD